MPFDPLNPPLRYRILGRLLLVKWLVFPIFLVWRFARACHSAFGPKPRIKLPPEAELPQWSSIFVEAAARVHEERSAAEYTGLTERERTLAQTMTWGTAGVAVVILVAIVTTANSPLRGALLISAGCFSFAVPLLVALGLVFTNYASPTKEPLAQEERKNLNLLVWFGQALVAIGLGVLLWSFDIWIFILYFMAIYLGRRALRNLGTNRLPPTAVSKVTGMLKPQAPTEATTPSDPPAASDLSAPADENPG